MTQSRCSGVKSAYGLGNSSSCAADSRTFSQLSSVFSSPASAGSVLQAQACRASAAKSQWPQRVSFGSDAWRASLRSSSRRLAPPTRLFPLLSAV